MSLSLLPTVALVAVVSITIIQAAPVHINSRPAYCPGVTANNESYKLQLAVSTVLNGSVTLPVNLTYEDWAAIKRRVLDAHAETTYTECLEHNTTVQPRDPKRLMCHLTYRCDYDAGRFPPYILHANCGNEEIHYHSGTSFGVCQCRPIYRPLTVLRFAGCDPYEQWRMEEQVVSVGCSCVNIR